MLYVTGHVSISLNDQMNKEWFIFKNTHHLGPFTLKEIEDFFRSGEINELSLVWKEGTEKWEALAKVKELGFLLPKAVETGLPPLPPSGSSLAEGDLPPPLPPLKASKAKNNQDQPPPVPLDALLDPSGAKKIFKDSKKANTVPRMIFGFVAAVFFFVVVWFVSNERSSDVQLKIKGLMPVYLEKLQEVASLQTSSFAMTMALSLDGKTLYGASNKDGEILSIIKIHSLPRRILATEEVELSVKGVMQNHLGEYTRMQMIKGQQFAPGEYNIDFTGRKIHFLNKTFGFLSSIAFFKNLNTTYHYQTTALVYPGTPREFEKKIAEYQASVADESIKPFSDKLERIQTFQALLNKTMEEYLKILGKMSRPQEMGEYEKMYLQEISPILQSLVVAASDLSKNGLDSGANAALAPYSEQVALGKQIGELGSDMITEMGKLKVITAADKKRLQSVFENRYTLIKIQIDNNIIKLQDQIKKLSH